MLNDISGVKTWDKVNSGLIKMYRAEVLAKLPVAQHIFFSHLLPFPGPDLPDPEDDHDHSSRPDEQASDKPRDVHVDEHGHVHVKGQGWGDCCGIPIPSAFAAAQQEKTGLRAVPGIASGNVRRIPFD
jgi:serine/threonine-protein phosphatase 2A activator